MAEGAPKAAYELTMERLKSRDGDAEAGIDHKPLTDEQKPRIGEIRNFYQAKLAELKVLHQGRVSWLRRTRGRATRAPAEDSWC